MREPIREPKKYVVSAMQKHAFEHMWTAKAEIILRMRNSSATTYCMHVITKTRLFKYTEKFTSKNWKFSDKKLWYISHFCSKHTLWVLVRTAPAVLTSTHNLCFEQNYEKYQRFFFLIFFSFFEGEFFSIYLNRRVFIMYCMLSNKWTVTREQVSSGYIQTVNIRISQRIYTV